MKDYLGVNCVYYAFKESIFVEIGFLYVTAYYTQ